jgi:molybdopterin-containing oxidoreductase family iron-sulfur binding subunit
MVIDIDRCTGCGACAIACAVENNVPPAHRDATERTGITWLQVSRITTGTRFPDADAAFIPVLCQHCENETPCVSVCPQNAVELDNGTGIVGQIPQRCLGCRYCMTACPYHARYFNWRDPEWPAGMERSLNPDVAPRMRGVVEKCNLCHGRLHAARQKAANEGREEINPADYIPACVEQCPAQAIIFGDLNDPATAVAAAASAEGSFRLLERLDTGAKVYYRTSRPWVREALEHSPAGKEASHG